MKRTKGRHNTDTASNSIQNSFPLRRTDENRFSMSQRKMMLKISSPTCDDDNTGGRRRRRQNVEMEASCGKERVH